jgi:thiol:disulfide interchange protein/DsbC/DsbD-like thiol-disulfide interchange protein
MNVPTPAATLAVLLMGVSLSLSQPSITEPVAASLMPEVVSFEPGKPFWVALSLQMEPGWHIYWRNPGDTGLPTAVSWQLPSGWKAGDIQWPYPDAFEFGGLINLGFEGDVVLLVSLTPPPGLKDGDVASLRARVEWLACKESCVPGEAQLTLNLPAAAGGARMSNEHRALFAQARSRLPIRSSDWGVQTTRGEGNLYIRLVQPVWYKGQLEGVTFFPYQSSLIQYAPAQKLEKADGGYVLSVALDPAFKGSLPEIGGVLVSKSGWTRTGSSKALEIRTRADQATVPAKSSGLSQAQNAPPKGGSPDNEPGAVTDAPQNSPASSPGASTPPPESPTLLLALGFAFLGGIILNLMPCVLPVLSLKIMGFVQQAGEDSKKKLKHGLLFTLGVLVSFWILSGLLLLLRASGEQLGWGFQLQSPAFVIVLSMFLYLFGLSMFGVFEIGVSLAGVGQNASGGASSWGSFTSGVLATVVATPCTAPFMGSALGFALSQPALVSFLIFTFLGLGMAAPYIILTSSPRLLRFVPKPGAWMESLKQFLGFLLMATVLWLLWVLGLQTGTNGMAVLLLALLAASVGGWIYGRWGNIAKEQPGRAIAQVLAALVVAGGLFFALQTIEPEVPSTEGIRHQGEIQWRPFSAEAVRRLREEGKPVFIDFTAAWCLSCQVNEKVAFSSAEVQRAFADKGIATFKADWTNRDTLITQALAQFGRNSVPLYVLYPSGMQGNPILLPELLTPGIVLEALESVR